MNNTNAWDLISVERKEPDGVLSDAFVMKFSRYLNWNDLSKYYDFSDYMLLMYQHRILWALVLKRQRLNETMLREMALNFDSDAWCVLSQYQVLSESFIADFADKVDWDNIILYQNVSNQFLRDHYEYSMPSSVEKKHTLL